MGNTLLCVLSLFLLNTLFYGKTEVSNKVTVTLQPNWPLIYRGEKITVRCEIQGGGGTEWTYQWRTPSSHTQWTNTDYWIISASQSHSGDYIYMCRGRRDLYSLTEWSQGVTVTVSGSEPTATLTADTTVTPAGGRVTLTCSVDGSDGWKYSWFRRTSEFSQAVLIKHGASDHTVSISEGGIYTCRGGRGEPELITQESNKVTVEETVSNKVTVTLQPNWPLIYRGEKITVRCEIQGGGDTEWTYEWRTPSSHTPPSHSEYRISVTLSHSGSYRCRGRKDLFSSTEWSDVIRLTVSYKPRASLTADTTVIPAGGRVTLTCSVDPSSGWKYDWYRDNKLSEPLNTHDADFHTTGQISVSEGGVYSCRGGRGDPVYYTEKSQEVRIDAIAPNRAVVTLQPDWTEIYRGERISVSCEIQGGDTEWTYEWETTSSLKASNQHEYRISSASSSHSGEYRCRGRMKSARHNTTEWSAAVNLTVYDNKPRPVLTVSPSWLSPGASVTLKCEVEHPSAGWRFSWYKAVPDVSHTSYSYELLPGNSSGTEQDSYIVHGQTHTAGYVCKAQRGDPVFYTEISEPKFVWSGDVHPSASLTVSPDRVQHFIYEDISLSCEGNSTEWRVRRFPEGGSLSCSDWRRMTGSRCDMFSSQRSDAVYWCESGSGEFSNTVNITVHDDYHDGVILVSPVRPVTEGESVTLGCRFRTEKIFSSVFFYHNDKLIQNDTRTELNISAVSKSDEGFYKCQSSGEVSPQSWMSVKAAVQRPESSSFPVMLTVRLVCGIVLIIVLLLCGCRKSTGPCVHRLTQTHRGNQGSATDQTVKHDENQQQVYSSLLHGDVCVYESIRGSENTGEGQCDGAEESSDYINVNPDSATGP